MLASTLSCTSLCGFPSTRESPSRFCLILDSIFDAMSTGEIYSNLGTGKVDYNRVSPGSLKRLSAAPYIFLPWYHSSLGTMHFHLGLGRF
jgi:hypothetical protein